MEEETAVLAGTRLPATCSHQENSILESEKILMLAVLEEALTSFKRYVHCGNGEEESLFVDVAEWMMIENKNWSISFERICQALELDPNSIRRALWMWRENVRNKSSLIPDFHRGIVPLKLDS